MLSRAKTLIIFGKMIPLLRRALLDSKKISSVDKRRIWNNLDRTYQFLISSYNAERTGLKKHRDGQTNLNAQSPKD